MAAKPSYEALLSQYNLAIARYQDLEEQYRTKKEQWAAKESEMKAVEENARSLCEAILAKDGGEMGLGESYTWRTIDTHTLLQKALGSYTRYNENRTDVMRKLLHAAEQRRDTIESLQDQIKRMMLQEKRKEPDPLATSLDVPPQLFSSKSGDEKEAPVPHKIKEAAKAEQIEVIIEENKDLRHDDLALEEEMAKIGAELQRKVMEQSIPATAAKARLDTIKKAKGKASGSMAHMVDLADIEEKMTAAAWAITEAIGHDGISEYPKIEARAKEILTQKTEAGEISKDNLKAVESKLRTAVRALDGMGVLGKEQLKLPLRPNMYVYRLSDIGGRLYERRFGNGAVLSELEKIIAEHDNAEHGYGIIDVAKILEESGRYSSVSAFNRAKKIEVRPGVFYEPDIIATIIPKGTAYFEYERGMYTQDNFNGKCNKMAKVTRWLNFIVPNSETLENRLIPQIRQWIESRGGAEKLKGLRVRVTPARTIKGANLQQDGSWQAVFDMTSSEPVRNHIEA